MENAAKEPFVICKASAGSGKTFNLVREYLTLAMAGGPGRVDDAFRHILAITFTNKAANEMKTRIMDTLDDIARHGVDPKRSKMGQGLLDELNARRQGQKPFGEGDLRTMAAELRSAILHRYSDLSVCTIDSFMHRVVRTFAHDLSQPVNFEVMIDQDELVEHAVSGLMSLVGTPGHEALTEMVRRYAVSNMEAGRNFDIVLSLTKLARQLFSEGSDDFLRRLAGYSFDDYMEMYDGYEKRCRDFERQLEALGAKAMGLLRSIGMGMEHCNGASRGFYAFFDKIEHFRDTLRDNRTFMPSDTVRNIFESADYSGDLLCRSKTTFPGTERIAQPLRTVFFDIAKLLGEPLVDYNTGCLLLRNLYSMALLGELNRQMHLYAKDNEMVHLSDFNRLINKVVQEEDMPFVYERLGSFYRHFLIDEFQDTSVLQWHNLVPLVEGGVAEGHESFVVGDGKQAIYRFRQGDVRQFVDLPQVKGLPRHGRLLSQPGMFRELSLAVNYRTTGAVVDFNNAFFSNLVRSRYAAPADPSSPSASAGPSLAERIYIGPKGLEAKLEDEALYQMHDVGKTSASEGYVGLEFVDAENNNNEPICAKVLEIIRLLVDERGYQPRDIYILGRTKEELAIVGSYLLEHSSIEQCSAESFYLRNSEAVLTLVAALRCLFDASDKVAVAELLHRLHALGLTTSPHDEAFLVEPAVPVAEVLASEGLEFDAGRLLAMDLYGCCEELVRCLRLDGLDMAYMSSLLNRVAAFSARHNQSLGDFIEWMDGHDKASAATSDEGNALQLMTIHKAKGLQAPVVICPIFNANPPENSVWVDAAKRFPMPGKTLPAAYVRLGQNSTRFDGERDAEKVASEVDDLNILYVAFTRPEEQLYVVCQKPDKRKGNLWYSVLADYAERHGASFGDKAFRHKQKKEKSADDEAGEVAVEPVDLRPQVSVNWLNNVAFSSSSEKALTPLLEEKVRFGIHAHALLASILHADDDVEALLAAYGERERVGPEEMERLAALVRDVLASEATARFFNPAYEVRNEIALTDGDREGRPDRVVFAHGETWVVDFKTGVDQKEKYDEQLRRYCRALSAMGFPSVSGWLVFLQPRVRVREVLPERLV